MFSKRNRKIIYLLVLSFFISSLLVFVFDIDLIKSLYELYYGNSNIGDFFKEQGQNVFTNEVRVTIFKLIISRTIYSIIPISIAMFIGVVYHAKKLPDRIVNSKIFEENPLLPKIIGVARYLVAVGLSFLIISFNRTFFNSTFHNCLLGNKTDFVRIVFASLVFLIPILDYSRLVKDIISFPQRHKKLTKLFFVFIISIISCCLVELQIGSKMNILDYLIHVNVMYWFILQLAFWALFRNVKPGAFISLILSFVIGLANDVVYQFRGNYIMFGDLTVIRTALEVVGNYTYKPTKWFWISLIIFIVCIVFVIILKLPQDKSEKKEKKIYRRIFTTVIFEALIAIFVIVTFKTGDFYGKVFGVGWDYNENVSAVGYLPYFFSNMDSTSRIDVSEYSADKVKNIFDDINLESNANNHQNEDESKVEPNIILIQNEAFSDLKITADIETDKDYMPFIHSMKDNTEKGYLNMSVTGGPTANTEFEILSRSSLQFFPYGSVPYTQYLKQSIPSLEEALKHQPVPYHTVAYHSYYSSGYNRMSAYSYLGFDEKVFENNFFKEYSSGELPRDYLSDEANYRRVIELFERSKNENPDNPFFCFNVTIQNHGGYTGGPYDLGESVKVTNFDATDSINTYLSLIKVSDTAFKNLVEYFEKVDEPTIIMMYGDHQPSWDDEAKELLASHPAWSDTMKQNLSAYYVPYIIWANYDIAESDELLPQDMKIENAVSNGNIKINSLSTNYVGSYLMNRAGVRLSEYDRFLLALQKNVPAITAIGLWDEYGDYYENAQSFPDVDKLKELEIIQYNLIFDDDNKFLEGFLP